MSCYTTPQSNCPPFPNNPCPVYVNAKCVYYSGANLIHIGVNTNDRLDVILQKIDAHFIDLGGTVTSVGLTSSDITVGGDTSPITSSGVFTLTLPDINLNVGTFNTLTVNAKGQVTSASNTAYITTVPINTLIAATGTNTINNTSFTQQWNWNTLVASGLSLGSTSTAANANNQILFSSSLSGANSNSGQTTKAGFFSNTHTGTTSTNMAIHAIASGGTTNYAGYFENTIRMATGANHLTLMGNNPSTITSDSAILISANNILTILCDSNGTIINPSAPNITGRFSVSGDSDNDMIFASYPNQTVGINTSTAVRSFEVFTKYLDQVANQTFWATRFTGRKYGSTGFNPILNGFGVGQEYALQNSTDVNRIVATTEYVYTDVTNASEDVDFTHSTITAGTLTPKIKIFSTGGIRFNNAFTFPATDGSASQVLTTNGSGTVTWQNGGGGGGGTVSEITFNATTDWGSPSGGYYSFAYTHSLNKTAVIAEVWDETSTPVLTFPEIVQRTSNNILTIKVPSSPDGRFIGRITII